MSFKPNIICFMCNWILRGEADPTNASRTQSFPNVHIVRVPCIGRIDPVIVLETFTKGADGVLVLGCGPPDCHYVEGNLYAEKQVKMLKKLLTLTSLGRKRLRLEWISAAVPESIRFAYLIEEFNEEIKALGPSLVNDENPELNILENLEAAKLAAEGFRLRVMLGRERELVERGNVYQEKISQREFDQKMDDIIRAEYLRHRIYLVAKNNPSSVKEISRLLGINAQKVLRHIVILRHRGLVTIDKIEGTTPLYTALEAGR